MYESGTMVPLQFLLPETAEEKDRTLVAVDHPKLGSETFKLAEVYCIASDCDCRRVILNVIRASDGAQVATVNWAFDEGNEDRRPFLDRLNAQSDHSRDLLKLLKGLLETDREYVERLERHYKMVKDAVADPRHPVHERLRGVERRTPMPENLQDAPDDLLARMWSMVGLDVPRALIDETLRRGERMVPHLGKLLTDEDLWDAGPEERDGWGPIHSIFLIRAIGNLAAASHVTEFLTRGLGEDWLTDEGAELVCSLGPDAIDVVWKVVTDDQAEGWGRVIAVDGLAMIGMSHEGARPRIVALLRELTGRLMEKPSRQLTDDESFLVEALFDALASLHDEDSRDLIWRGFRDGHSKMSRADQRKLLELYREPIEKILSDLRTDPIEHFSEGNLEELKDLHGFWDEDATDDDDWAPAEGKAPPPPIVSSPKVGRNEPCPCGSGKKYKKCCLAT